MCYNIAIKRDALGIFILGLIFGALVVISGILFSINGILQNIREAIEYTSISTDYLLYIKEAIEQ